MTWFKVDDDLAFHRKAVSAGNAAMGLWVRSGAWCSAHLTDGFVPDEIIALLGTSAQRQKLIKAKLWIEVEGGCQFHEWNEDGRQPTSKSVREARAKSAARQTKHRNGIIANPQVSNATNGVSGALVTPSVTGVVTGAPTRPDPNQEKEDPLALLDAPEPKPSNDDRFAEFYEAYPRRQDRRSAEKAWRAAMKRGANPDHVIDRARAYARLQIGNERRFVKLPATWLNAGSYDDEIESPNLSLVPASFDDLRARADAIAASRLLCRPYIPKPQPPSDDTPARVWDRTQALAFIDSHRDVLLAVLAEKGKTA